MTSIQFQDPAGDIVEEIAIVGDGDDRAWIVVEKAFEPSYRLRIQMIRWLVQKQQVGVRQ